MTFLGKVCVTIRKYVSPCEKYVSPCEKYVSPWEKYVSPCEKYVSPWEKYVSPCEKYVSLCEKYVSPCENIKRSESLRRQKISQTKKLKNSVFPPSMPKSLKWCLPLVWKSLVAQFVRDFIYNTNINTFVRYIK